jgi:carbamoyl-phosphate synthase small subunit
MPHDPVAVAAPPPPASSAPTASSAPVARSTPARSSPARLVLEDGSVYHGLGFGAASDAATCGEVVFNTAMVGYQEAFSDPSYRGQILVMTVPHVGNYGIAAEDGESAGPMVAGVVVRELSRVVSNQRAVGDLDQWLRTAGVPGIERIDTRALVRRLRTAGALRGTICGDPRRSDGDLVDLARTAPAMSGCDLASQVSPRRPGRFEEGLGAWAPAATPSGRPDRPLRVVAIDCGAKRNIYRHLVERGCEVHVLPHDATSAAIRAERPDGLFVSNGPGDPAAVEATVATLAEIAGEVPTFGICLGHQLLALALGARTWKLKFGHRGANQPVRNLLTGRVEITSQNHGFCVDEASLDAAGGEVTHRHLNDGTVAGFRHRTRPIFSVQYHPEASPGPHDSAYLFDLFVESMRQGQPLSVETWAQVQRGEVPTHRPPRGVASVPLATPIR